MTRLVASNANMQISGLELIRACYKEKKIVSAFEIDVMPVIAIVNSSKHLNSSWTIIGSGVQFSAGMGLILVYTVCIYKYTGIQIMMYIR